MSVLKPISKLGSGRPGSGRTAGLCLLFGIVLGGAGGFFIGRSLGPPALAPAPAAACPNVATRPAADAGSQTHPADQQAADNASSDTEKPRRIDLTVKGSLYSSLAHEIKGHAADVLNAHLGRIMVWWFDLRRDVMKGDRALILYQPAEDPENMRVLALRYASAKLNKTLGAYYFKRRGSNYGHYYDPGGVEIEQHLVHSPIEHYEQITERMNLAGRRHHGVDFKTDEGTLVVSPFRARIERRNWNTRRNGNCLQLLYMKSGIRAYFLHLSEILPIARPGRVVEAGTPIAKTGNTGHSTAPHLHYELHGRDNHLLDPFEVSKAEHRRLSGNDLAEFKAQRDRLDRELGVEAAAHESSAAPSGSSASNATAE